MWPVEEIPSCDSTQNWAFAQIVAAPQRGNFAVFTLAQTAGVGRQGNAWLDSGRGLALSLAWSATGHSGLASGWPAWMSLWTVESLMARYGEQARAIGLKWPNDIVADGRKLGGVLVQHRQVQGRSWLVAGVGLNLRWQAPPPDGIDATDLASVLGLSAQGDSVLLDPMALVRGIVDRTSQALLAPAPADWAARFNARDVYRGQEVLLLTGQKEHLDPQRRLPPVVGTHVGIDAEARIGIHTQQTGLRYYSLGEVSLRSGVGRPLG